MQLVLNPWQFDVIVTTNLFGDILSDEMAGLVGGWGWPLRPTLAWMPRFSRPCMALRRILRVRALPIRSRFSSRPPWCFDHIDRSELAHRLRKAINQTLNEDQVRTGDLGGKASTKEFAQAIVRRL